MVFENSRYLVKANEALTGYEVVNKETGVVEYEHTTLPRSIIAATEYSEWLDKHDGPKGEVNETNVIRLR